MGFDIDAARSTSSSGGHDRTGEVDDATRWPHRRSASARPPRTSPGGPSSWSPYPLPSTSTTARTSRRSSAPRRPSAASSSPARSSSTSRPSTPARPRRSAAPRSKRASGLRAGVDFSLGYSPERINPGDREHTLGASSRSSSGQDADTLERVAAAYERIIPAGVHRAPSIMVAEAAKVIENTQRDLNIALMNELALIFDRLGSAPPTCSRRPARSGTSCPSRPGSWAGTASASTPTT